MVAELHAETPVDSTYDWQHLIQNANYEDARRLCEGWLKTDERLAQTEAHKCLANVEVGLSEKGVRLEGNDVGGGAIRPDFTWSSVDKAIEHLDKAAALSPEDVSIHQGRIALLKAAGRYKDIPGYLEKSVLAYKGEDAVDVFLGSLYSLFEDRQLYAALDSFKVLEKYYADSHMVVANIGAVLTLLEKDDEAIVYVKKAVDMAPDDPINNWNLARLYDYTGKEKLAERYYLKSLELEQNPEKKSAWSCAVGEFMETKLGDLKRACTLQRENCPKDRQTACR
jgi:tetratricopeptide (TPR) repeat protein